MTELVTEVVDVATQRLKYVPPQIEVVELEPQGAMLITSGKGLWGNSLIDDGDEWSE
ncbi:MAG: hypothetical protein J6T96_02710 [Bacteroidales bacterium]|nr:hypothetical protein [Bacteroidales bacterium]MBO7461488.1 hypothetical protein [Bacteroidales bacterium]